MKGFSCSCKANSIEVGYEHDLPKCEMCLPGTIVTLDKKNCIPCEEKNNRTCACTADEIRGIVKILYFCITSIPTCKHTSTYIP